MFSPHRHTVSSGVWTSFLLKSRAPNHGVTIAEAIHQWLVAQRNYTTVRYDDMCRGPHCNPSCPDQVVLGSVAPYWNHIIQYVLLVVCVMATVICAAAKIVLYTHYKLTRRTQRKAMEECSFHSCIEESTVSCVVTLWYTCLKYYTGTCHFCDWCVWRVCFEWQTHERITFLAH